MRAISARLNIPAVDGKAQIGFASTNAFPGQDMISMEVSARTLDEYEFRDVCFIKIDVEGQELKVLEGAARTVQRDQPILLVEIAEPHQAVPIGKVFSAIVALGYRGYFVFQGALRSVERFDTAYHQRGYLEGRQSGKCFFLGPQHELSALIESPGSTSDPST